MTKQRSADQVVIDGGYRLTGIDIAKLHERRFILRFNDDRLSQVKLEQSVGLSKQSKETNAP